MIKKLMCGLACLMFPLACVAAGFSFTDTEGRTHTLSDYEGKWVLVNLWATWCSPCIAEMPELEALSRARQDLVVLGLAIDGHNARRIKQFAEKLHVTYPVIAGNEQLARQFKPKGYPTSILYNPAGIQVWVKEGSLTRQETERAITRYSTPNAVK